MSVTQSVSENQSALCICIINLHTTIIVKPVNLWSHSGNCMKVSDFILGPPTWIVFPFLALTTSPGLVAFPLGMFSHKGARPDKCVYAQRFDVRTTVLKSRLGFYGLILIKEDSYAQKLTDNVDGQLESCCCDDGRTHGGSSTHISSHRIHRGRRLQRNTTTTDKRREW